MIKEIIKIKVVPRFIRMENGGENLEVEKLLNENMLDIQVEYTPRDTPQHNGIVERSFQTLYNCIRSMLNGAGIYGLLRYNVWTKCSKTATVLNDMTVNQDKNITPYEELYNKNMKIMSYMKTFGDMGTVKTEYSNVTQKLANKG